MSKFIKCVDLVLESSHLTSSVGAIVRNMSQHRKKPPFNALFLLFLVSK